MGCSPKYEKQVVISLDSTQPYSSPILASFSRQFAEDELQVTKRPLEHQDRTVGSAKPFPVQSAPPVCDLVWDSDLLRTLNWQKRGLLQPRKWPIPKEWPSMFRANDGTWVAFAGRARVLLLSDQLASSTAPSRVFDLGDPQWKGKCGVASMASQSLRAHLAILAAHADSIFMESNNDTAITTERKNLEFNAWITRVVDNANIYLSERDAAEAVLKGEVSWVLVDSDVALAARDRSPALKIVFPDQDTNGFGAVLLPNTVSVLKDAQNPNIAGRLADFLISNDVEARLTISDSALIPLNPSPKELSRLLKGVDIHWAQIDFATLMDSWERIADSPANNLRVNRTE